MHQNNREKEEGERKRNATGEKEEGERRKRNAGRSCKKITFLQSGSRSS
jgi:hypothetical protein